MRHRSRLNRLIAAMTALTTVLCLGCSGLEPMIDAMHGSVVSGAMACSGDAGTMPATGEGDSQAHAHVPTGSQGVIPVSVQSGTQRSYDCGCRSCTAPGTPAMAVHAIHAPSPDVLIADPVPLVGIPTQPLVPPPERVI